MGSKRGGQKTKETYKAQKADKQAALLNAFDACNIDGNITLSDLAEYLGVGERSVRRRIDECEKLEIKNGEVIRKESKES